MSDPRYVATVQLAANGKYRWSVTTSDIEEYPLYRDDTFSLRTNEIDGYARRFNRAARSAADELAKWIARDVRRELVDSFESNVPIAQAGSS